MKRADGRILTLLVLLGAGLTGGVARASVLSCVGVSNGTPCGGDCVADGRCVNGSCKVKSVVADGTPCSTGNHCTSADSCLAGVCSPGQNVDCPGAAPFQCVLGACDPMVGCYQYSICPDVVLTDGGVVIIGQDAGPGGDAGTTGDAAAPGGDGGSASGDGGNASGDGGAAAADGGVGDAAAVTPSTGPGYLADTPVMLDVGPRAATHVRGSHIGDGCSMGAGRSPRPDRRPLGALLVTLGAGLLLFGIRRAATRRAGGWRQSR